MKIVIIDAVDMLPEHVEVLRQYGEVVVYNDIPTEDEGIKRIVDADIIQRYPPPLAVSARRGLPFPVK